MPTTISLRDNPWCVPSGPVYLEGSPTPEEAERDRRRTAAARAAWRPEPGAWALVERLRAEAVGHEIQVQDWEIDWEPVAPVRGRLIDIVISREPEGHEQAILVMEGAAHVGDDLQVHLMLDDRGLHRHPLAWTM